MQQRQRERFGNFAKHVFAKRIAKLGSRLFVVGGLLGGFLLVHSALQSPASNAQTAGICPAQLDDSIDAILQRPEFRRSRWGILVQTQGDQQTLYAQNAEQYFIPASNVKLLTTAAVLEQWGERYRIRTSVYQLNSQTGDVVLRVVGRGDPSLTDEDLRTLAQQIRDRGITEVSLLIGDDSYFQGNAINPTWEWQDIQAGYGAPVNSLILNQNAIGFTLVPQALGQPLQVVWDDPTEYDQWQINNRSLTVDGNASEFVSVGRDLNQRVLYVQGQLREGSVPEPVAVSIPQPAQYFMQRFLLALAAEDISVQQTLVTSSPISELGNEIASVESPPLAELLIETNQQSNNLYAEALLQSLSTARSSTAGASSDESSSNESSLDVSLNALTTILTQLGVAPDGYALADGSGLSRHNRVSPEAIVQTLQGMARSHNAETYQNSLSVAGVSGTLTNRFRDTPVQGNLQAKTGSLTDTTALSGYLKPSNYTGLTVSIIANQFNQPLGQIQRTIDEIVEHLAQLRTC